MKPPARHFARPLPRLCRAAALACLACVNAWAADAPSAPSGVPASRIQLTGRPAFVEPREAPKSEAPREGSRGEQLREAIEQANGSPAAAASKAGGPRKGASVPTPQFTFNLDPDKKAPPAKRVANPAVGPANAAPPRVKAEASDDEVGRQYIRARAIALGTFATTPSAAAAVGGGRTPMRAASPASAPTEGLPWSYQGAAGPLSWGQLKPEFAICGTGQRQSPIAIDDASALVGPAEPLLIDLKPSTGLVTHTGRTLQVDVQGDNTLTLRGTRYALTRMDFHHPAEEKINGKGFAMAAHLQLRSADGQLAMVAVLLEPGPASAVVDQVLTYLPLDAGDRVGLPPAGLDLAALLPQDARYYQFFGSLTAPPCTEGVLWIVFKQPMTLSAAQLKLFGQLFPNNARPVQPVNGRVVRAAQ